MEKKIKTIILVLVIILIALGSTMAYAYFFTDYLKSNKEVFFKYILKNEEFIKELKDEDFSKYIEKQKNTPYSNSGEIAISSDAEEITQDSDIKLTFKGNRDDNSQYFKQDININMANESLEIELLKQEDIYGFKIDNMFKKFLAVQNKDLKKWAKILEMRDEQIETMPDKIEFNNIKGFSDEEINNFSQKYKNIINENLTDDMFSKEKENKITFYKLKLTKQQYNNIMIKILEVAKDDDIILNKINEICGQESESSKDNIIKMYQENIENEIEDLKNIDSEEASKEVVFNVGYDAKEKIVKTQKIIDNKKYVMSIDSNKIDILYNENDESGNEIDKQEMHIIKAKDNDKLTYSINLIPEDTAKNTTIKYTIDGIENLENVEEQIEVSGNYNPSSLVLKNYVESEEDKKASLEEDTIYTRLETIIMNKNDENSEITLEDLTQGFSGVSNLKISKSQEEDNQSGFTIESKDTGYTYEINKDGEIISVLANNSNENNGENNEEQDTKRFSINYKNTKKFNANLTTEKVDSKDIMLLNNKNAESLQQLVEKISEQIVMQTMNSNSTNSSEQTNQ